MNGEEVKGKKQLSHGDIITIVDRRFLFSEPQRTPTFLRVETFFFLTLRSIDATGSGANEHTGVIGEAGKALQTLRELSARTGGRVVVL